MKVLFIRVSSLGDVLHAMPVVADILTHFPHATIDWVVEESFIDLVKLNASIEHIIPFGLRRWRHQLLSPRTWEEIQQFKRALQTETYDLVLDCQGLIKTGVIMGLAQGHAKVGFANATVGSGFEKLSCVFHTKSIKTDPYTHAITRNRLLAAHALGYVNELSITPLNFNLKQPHCRAPWLPHNPYVTFFYGSAGKHKKWPLSQWSTVGKYVNAHGYPVLLCYGNAEEQAEAVALASTLNNVHILPKLSLIEAILLAQKAHVVIGLDTGLTHIAAAFCRPTIELYVHSPRWKTEGNWSNHIINLGDINKPPHPQDVMAAFDQLTG